jgi:hypothetical protein
MDIALNGSGGVRYNWSFSGDIVGSFVGGNSNTQNAVFRCTEEYSGTATLTVTDEYGIKDSVTHPVATAVTAPTAAFVSTIVGGKVTLDALTSTSPNGDVVGYSWSFAPALPATYLLGDSEKPVITLLFSSNYTGTATLSIVDDKGKEDDASSALNVTIVTPVPVISATQANDVLRLDASGSTGATNYLWAFSGSPVGYWSVGDANTEIAHFKFEEVYTGTLSLTVNGVTTSTPITVDFGVAISFAGRTATAYAPLIPLTVYPGFAESVAYAFGFIATNVYYVDPAIRSATAYAAALQQYVKASFALRSAQGYTVAIKQNLLAPSILRTPSAFDAYLTCAISPTPALRTSTAFSVTLAPSIIPDTAIRVAEGYPVVTPYVSAGFASRTPQVYTIILNSVSPSFASRTATGYDYDITFA